MEHLTGSFHLLFLYDVSEEIDLELLRKMLQLDQPQREPAFRQPSPEYVRFSKPPLAARAAPLVLAGGERLETRVKYYDYGVIAVEFELPFESDWQELERRSAQWIASPEMEQHAARVLEKQLLAAGDALVRRNEQTLAEDYAIVFVNAASTGMQPARALLAEHGERIARIVRGEASPLAPEECAEVLGGHMSYYPADLVVAGWSAAFVYDTPENLLPTLQLLEYANTQLLEFRYYDELLTPRLKRVYDLLEGPRNLFWRWQLAKEAQRLNTIRLDVRELTERVDTSIKFLSDMYSARLYRLAAAKVGAPDYRKLVEGKLETAGELYHFMDRAKRVLKETGAADVSSTGEADADFATTDRPVRSA